MEEEKVLAVETDQINSLPMHICCQLQSKIDKISVSSYETDPDKFKPMRSQMHRLRDESNILAGIMTKIRRAALKEQVIKEHKELEEGLLRIGMGFIPTHP